MQTVERLSCVEEHGGILIAEDDDELRESLSTLLRHLGYWVCGVKDGSQLFEWTEPIILGEYFRWIPDLILTDLSMPGIPPIQVLDALRYVGCDVPVVIISGLRDSSLRQTASEMGYEWLDKPVNARRVEEAVRRAIA